MTHLKGDQTEAFAAEELMYKILTFCCPLKKDSDENILIWTNLKIFDTTAFQRFL